MRARASFVLPYGPGCGFSVTVVTLGNISRHGGGYLDSPWNGGTLYADRMLRINVPLDGSWSPESVAAALVGNTGAQPGYVQQSSLPPQIAAIESWSANVYNGVFRPAASNAAIGTQVLVIDVVWRTDRCRDGSLPFAGYQLGCPVRAMTLSPANYANYPNVQPSRVLLTDDDLIHNGTVTGPSGALRALLEAVAVPEDPI